MPWKFYDSVGNMLQSTVIGDATVTLAKMATNSVDSDQYVDGSIDVAHMSANSVDSAQYVDASIDTAHIGNLQVTTALIAADAIDGTKLADNAVDSEHYTDGSIDNAHIADDAIDSEHYADGSIDNAHIADDQIDSEHYAAGSIDTAHIADNQITLAKMAGIARGKIIYGDASGDPAVLAVGSEDQVLTHDGTDVSWEDASTLELGSGSSQAAPGDHGHSVVSDVSGVAFASTVVTTLDTSEYQKYYVDLIASGADLDIASTTNTFAAGSLAFGAAISRGRSWTTSALKVRLIMGGVQVAESGYLINGGYYYTAIGFRALSGSQACICRIHNYYGSTESYFSLAWHFGTNPREGSISVGSVKV